MLSFNLTLPLFERNQYLSLQYKNSKDPQYDKTTSSGNAVTSPFKLSAVKQCM